VDFVRRLEPVLPGDVRATLLDDPPRYTVEHAASGTRVEVEDLGGYWHVLISPTDDVELPPSAPVLERLLTTLGRDPLYRVSAHVGPIHVGRWVEFTDGTAIIHQVGWLDRVIPRLPHHRRDRTRLVQPLA
jgi:hypothetical protein